MLKQFLVVFAMVSSILVIIMNGVDGVWNSKTQSHYDYRNYDQCSIVCWTDPQSSNFQPYTFYHAGMGVTFKVHNQHTISDVHVLSNTTSCEPYFVDAVACSDFSINDTINNNNYGNNASNFMSNTIKAVSIDGDFSHTCFIIEDDTPPGGVATADLLTIYAMIKPPFQSMEIPQQYESFTDQIIEFLKCNNYFATDFTQIINPSKPQIKILSLGYGFGEVTRRLYQKMPHTKHIRISNDRDKYNHGMFDTTSDLSQNMPAIPIQIDGVDISDQMIQLGKDWLCIDWDKIHLKNQNDQINVFNIDANDYIDDMLQCWNEFDEFDNSECQSYDVILMDIFDFQSPDPLPEFYSVNFFKRIKQIWDKSSEHDYRSTSTLSNGKPKLLIANLDTDYQDQKDIIRQDVLTNAQIVFGTDTSKVSVGFDEDQTLQLIYYP